MASDTSISNRALQKLGAARIVSLDDDTKNARACKACYEALRDSELRKHPWRFAIKRQILAPSATSPEFDFTYQFNLPAGCLKILKPQDPCLDWQLEGRKILTNLSATLNLRFIDTITDPNLFDVNFCEMLSMMMAKEMCEEITQSTNKQASITEDYKTAKEEAKKSNAFETISIPIEESSWTLTRN